MASFIVRLLFHNHRCQNKQGPKREMLQRLDLFSNFQAGPRVLLDLPSSLLFFTSDTHSTLLQPQISAMLTVAIQVTLIKSLFLSLPRSHHHFVHTPHGRSRHLRRPHCHHLPRQAALLRLVALLEEILWQRLLPHSGARWDGKDDGSANWYHTKSDQRGTTATHVPHRPLLVFM